MLTELFMDLTAFLFWERRRLCGVLAESSGARAQLRHQFAIPWTDDSDPLQFPMKATELLKQAVAQSRLQPTRTVICLSREDVILRHLTVPDVPDEELPDLVRFQAAARATQSLDQLLLDFLPLPKQPGHEGRPVLAVTAPKSLATGIQAVVQGAGLEPAASITFSSIGLAELLAHANREPKSTATLGVVRDGPRVELVVLADRSLLYAHSARLSADDNGLVPPAALLAEVSRTIVAAQRLHPQLQIQKAFVTDCDADSQPLIARLTERLEVPVESFALTNLPSVDTSCPGWPAEPAADSVLLGLVLAEMQRLTPRFDFLHPRQPPAKIDPRKLQYAVGSAAALLIAALTFSVVETTRASLQGEIERLGRQEAELDLKLTPGKATLLAAKLIDDWQAGNVNQIAQFSELSDLMGGTEQMYLSQYNFTAGQGEVRGNMQALGNARTREDIPHFYQRLTDTGRYRIQPRQLLQSGRDDEYPNRFELHADLLPNPKPTTPTTETKPPAKKDG